MEFQIHRMSIKIIDLASYSIPKIPRNLTDLFACVLSVNK